MKTLRDNVQAAAKKASYPLFIPFIMAGDPDKETTIQLALALEEQGAHILELGIPYSDPLADGPVLQRSAERARGQGITLEKSLTLIPEMRKRGLTIPVVIFTYYNPILQFGEDRFINCAKESGADGVLVPDLPFEESQEFAKNAKENGLSFISLVAPTSKHRIEKIAKEAQGFLYCVSSLGVTGTRENFPPEAFSFIKQVKKHAEVPVAVGFGISKKEHVKDLQGSCDGVIIGSAIMKEVEKHKDRLKKESEREEAINSLKEFVAGIISS
ncbi:tryptophan synthase subunit alpha [Thalassorhabdus alkalitolerans]|uniref:Tryptophan synthase alpha chain n=1 Tax=Thalassorhabdus alkalitolerans TaxID=2282697 RepID=A0ABW0YS66_9BACI